MVRLNLPASAHAESSESKRMAAECMRRCLSDGGADVQGGLKRACPLRESMIWRTLVRPAICGIATCLRGCRNRLMSCGWPLLGRISPLGNHI